MPRDKSQTRQGILKAVGRLLARSGFRELGINSIAREAAVDKVLIYRYFGGLPELLKAFAEESDFWPDLRELSAQESDGNFAASTEAERARLMMLAFGRALRGRPLTQEILRWELLEPNELTDALSRYREEQGSKVFEHLERTAGTGVDMRAVGSLLSAGQTYLILHSKNCRFYNGLDLQSDDGWARIERAAAFLVDAAFAAGGVSKPAEDGKGRAATKHVRGPKAPRTK